MTFEEERERERERERESNTLEEKKIGRNGCCCAIECENEQRRIRREDGAGRRGQFPRRRERLKLKLKSKQP